MMSVDMKSSFARMKEYDSMLKATDFSSYRWAYVVNEEGGVIMFRNAIMKMDGEYLWVFSEHEVPLIFHVDELVNYHYLEEIDID